MQPVIVMPSVSHVRSWSAMIKVHYTLDWHLCTVFEGLRVLLRISVWFSCHFAGFHIMNLSGYTFVTNAQTYIKSFSTFFANTVMHTHCQRVYHIFHDTPCNIGLSVVRTDP